MKIGLSSWAFPLAAGEIGQAARGKSLDAFGLVEKAILFGAEVVQIADNMPTDDSMLAKVWQLAAANHIEIELGIAGTSPEAVSEGIRRAGLCGASLIRTLPHSGRDIPDPEELICRLRAAAPLLRDHGMRLAVENHDHYTSVELGHVMETVHAPEVGICLDSVNNYGKGESFRETFANLAPYVINFHVKDFLINRIPRQTGFSIVGAPAGEGLLDLMFFASLLPDSINWILEQWSPVAGSPEESIRQEEQWAESGIKRLKSISKSCSEASLPVIHR